MDATGIIVGSKDCTFSAIQRSLQQSKNLDAFLRNWMKLAMHLDVSSETVDLVGEMMQKNTITIFETLEILLQEWKSLNPRNANLTNLINKLRRVGLSDFANALSMHLPVQTFQTTNFNKNVDKISNTLWTDTLANTNETSCSFLPPTDRKNQKRRRWFSSRRLQSVLVYVLLLLLLPLMFVLGELHNASDKASQSREYALHVEKMSLEPLQASRSPDNFSTELSTSTQRGAMGIIDEKETTCFRIVVGSYKDFQNQIQSLNESQSICVTFHMDSNTTWNKTSILSQSQFVVEVVLSGEMNIDLLLDSLSQFPNIEKLTIANQISTHNNLCSNYDKVEASRLVTDKRNVRKKFKLSRLLQLNLEGFDSCPHLINSLPEYVIMDRIQEIQISKSMIDSSNVKAVQMILEKTRFSLEVIKFFQVQIEVPLLNGFHRVLCKVKEVIFEQPIAGKASEMIFTNAFYKVLPNVEILSCKNNYIHSSHLSEILKLKEIRNLEIGLYMPPGEKFFPIILAEKFQNLEKVMLNLKFANPFKCFVVGAESVAHRFYLKIVSNGCEIKYEAETL